jgi:hypothetical protein
MPNVQTNLKFQTPMAMHAIHWDLELGVCLGFGAWSLGIHSGMKNAGI